MFTLEELLPTYDPKFVAIGDKYLRAIEMDAFLFAEKIRELDSTILSNNPKNFVTRTGVLLSIIEGGK